LTRQQPAQYCFQPHPTGPTPTNAQYLSVLLLSSGLLAACGQSPEPDTDVAEAPLAAQQQSPATSRETPAQPSIPEYSIEEFMDSEQIRGAGFSFDDDRIAYSSNHGGVFNVYAQPVEGGDPLQLTGSTTDPRSFGSWFPNDGRLIFSGDQGGNDPRVLQVESDEIVEAIRNNGLPVEYVLFDDEGHGFRNRANEIEGYRAIREFLDQYLASQPASMPANLIMAMHVILLGSLCIASVVDVSRFARERPGIVYSLKDTEIILHSVEPGLPADIAGLRNGDLIVSAAETRLTGLTEFVATVAQAVDQTGSLALVMQRDARQMDIELRPGTALNPSAPIAQFVLICIHQSNHR